MLYQAEMRAAASSPCPRRPAQANNPSLSQSLPSRQCSGEAGPQLLIQRPLIGQCLKISASGWSLWPHNGLWLANSDTTLRSWLKWFSFNERNAVWIVKVTMNPLNLILEIHFSFLVKSCKLFLLLREWNQEGITMFSREITQNYIWSFLVSKCNVFSLNTRILLREELSSPSPKSSPPWPNPNPKPKEVPNLKV